MRPIFITLSYGLFLLVFTLGFVEDTYSQTTDRQGNECFKPHPMPTELVSGDGNNCVMIKNNTCLDRKYSVKFINSCTRPVYVEVVFGGNVKKQGWVSEMKDNKPGVYAPSCLEAMHGCKGSYDYSWRLGGDYGQTEYTPSKRKQTYPSFSDPPSYQDTPSYQETSPYENPESASLGNSQKNTPGQCSYRNRDGGMGYNYSGSCFNNQAHGNGTLVYDNGAKYQGEFKFGKFHGQGTMYFVNGSRFEGRFVNGGDFARGITYYTNGDRFDGETRFGNPWKGMYSMTNSKKCYVDNGKSVDSSCMTLGKPIN